MFQAKDETGITLGVLNAVANSASVTQRSVAKELGIALGLANTYLRRCIKKGLIKAQQVPARRYAYYLTPQGFAEKSRLTAKYLSQGFQFFRVARSQFDGLFEECERLRLNRIVLHGLTDLAEIAVLSARDRSLMITAIVDESTTRESYHGIAVRQSLPDADDFDCVVITDLGDPQGSYDALARSIAEWRICAPEILNVTRNPSISAA